MLNKLATIPRSNMLKIWTHFVKLRLVDLDCHQSHQRQVATTIWIFLLISSIGADLVCQSATASELAESDRLMHSQETLPKIAAETAPVPEAKIAPPVFVASNLGLAEAISWLTSVHQIEPKIALPPHRKTTQIASLTLPAIVQKPSDVVNPIEEFPRKLTPEQRSIDPIAPPIVAPPNTAPIPLPKPAKLTPGYLIAPHLLDLRKIEPSVTQIPIDGVSTTHRTQYEVTSGVDTGDRRTTNIGLSAIGVFSPSLEESVSANRVYRLDYRSTYSQIRTIRQQREITTSLNTPETALGMRQQLSFVGTCLTAPNGSQTVDSTKLCTFIPGIRTDNTSIDPKLQIPTRFIQGAQFGDVVTPASLAAIRAPGFQLGANGQELGIDLYFPRVGTQPGNSLGTKEYIDRFESISTVPTVSFGRLRQIIATNGKEVALARTIRGFNYISGDSNTGLISGIQAITELLPDIEPVVSPGKKGGSTAINRNLVLAANNNRIPENSFTAYYGGSGKGDTPKPNQLLAANYQGIWVGFSPVVDRGIATDKAFQNIGAPRIVTFAGGEGGVDSTASIVAAINKNSFTSNEINSAYVQAYLTRYEQDSNTLNRTTLREKTSYYPHFSATGNVTTADSVLRYYTGLIFNSNNGSNNANNKIYGGIDYTKVEANGINYNLAAIGYTNPDPEYYSRIAGNVSKAINLGRNPAYNLALTAGFNYAFDGNSKFDNFNFRSGNSFLNIGTRANLGSFSVGATYFLPNGLPNPVNQLLSLSGSWQVRDGIATSIYYTPVNANATRSPFGVGANFRLGKDVNSPTLSLNWSHNQSDFGTSASGTKLGVADNVFSIYLRFGAPGNPLGR